MSGYYYCYDGDRIGEAIQRCFLEGDLKSAILRSKSVYEAIALIKREMVNLGAELVFEGGDSMIFRHGELLPPAAIPHIAGDVTFSVGVGSSLQSASIELFRAKALGRARIMGA